MSPKLLIEPPFSEYTSFQVFHSNRLYSLLLSFIAKNLDNGCNTSFVPTITSGPNNCSDKRRQFDEEEEEYIDEGSTANEFVGFDDNASSLVNLSLGIGRYKLLYNDEPIVAVHHEVGNPVGARCGAETRRDLTLFIEGSNREEVLREFTFKIYKASIEGAKKGAFKIYRWMHEMWTHERTVMARRLESVIMDPAIKAQLLDDLEDFLSKEARQFYRVHGIPYRRSYLLHGVPGAGKTSIIQAIAGKYGRSVCFINPTNRNVTDDVFQMALQELPPKAILVLEDIDSLFDKNRKRQHGDQNPLTFSGLLNAIDGVSSGEGQLLFMTTNFRNRLDPALIRPGRVDLHVHFPYATQYQMREYFQQFYPNAPSSMAEMFASKLTDQLMKRSDDRGKLGAERNLSTAGLQHFFVTHRKKTAAEAVECVSDIIEELRAREEEEEKLKISRKEAEEAQEVEENGEGDDEEKEVEEEVEGMRMKKKRKWSKCVSTQQEFQRIVKMIGRTL